MNRGLRGFFIAACFFFVLEQPAEAADYTIDPTHTFVEFRIQHLGYSWLYGRFNDIKGSFSYDEARPAKSSFNIEISTESLDSNHARRDKHLRGSDFLDVAKFPKAIFKSKSFDGAKLLGDLTLHGVTKEIVIDVKKVGEGKDPWGGYRAGFIGTTKLDRSDFGISYDLGPASNIMEFELGIEGIRKQNGYLDFDDAYIRQQQEFTLLAVLYAYSCRSYFIPACSWLVYDAAWILSPMVSRRPRSA